MTLRKKTFRIVAVAILGLLCMLLLTANKILLSSFAVLERHEVEQNIARADNVIQAELASLDDIAQDWAFWDDSYQFIDDHNDDYKQKNLIPSAYQSVRVNIVVLLDAEGNIVYGTCYDLVTRTESALTEEMKQCIRNKMAVSQVPQTGVRGMLMLSEGPVLVVARPITDSEISKPSRGTVIVGRYLDDAKISALTETAQLSLSLYPYDGGNVPPDVEEIQSQLTDVVLQAIRPLSDQSIAGYALVYDIDKNPALIMRVDMPRDVYRQGKLTFHYLLGALLVIGLVFIFVHIVILNRVILDRLARLSQRLKEIAQSGCPTARVNESGNDELSEVAMSVNHMLRSLQLAQEELRTSESINSVLLESMPDSILLLDESGVILDFKTGRHRCAAVPSLLFPGKKIDEIYPCDVAAQFMSRIKEAIRTRVQQVYKQEVRIGGTIVVQEVRIDVGAEGEVIAVIRDFSKKEQ